MSVVSYDEALFRQILKRKPYPWTKEQVLAAFKTCAWEIFETIKEGKAEVPVTEEEAERWAMENIVPGLIVTLKEEGHTFNE